MSSSKGLFKFLIVVLCALILAGTAGFFVYRSEVWAENIKNEREMNDNEYKRVTSVLDRLECIKSISMASTLKSQEEAFDTQEAEAEEAYWIWWEEEQERIRQEEERKRREEEARRAASAMASGTAGDYQQYAYSLFGNYGWTAYDFECLVALWNRESRWNPNAHNSSSGAHGIPQALPASKMASHGSDYYTNPYTQIRWGLDYIAGRYGSPSNAWAHSQSVGWY